VSVIGKIWTSPNTLLGLLIGLTGVPFGARIRRGDNAILFCNLPLLSHLPPKAITFGNVVLYRRDAWPEREVRRYDGKGRQRIGDHERAHTIQYELWGPFFLPVYLLLALLPGAHPLETQADRWAEKRISESG
jgi:hypothetical protein